MAPNWHFFAQKQENNTSLPRRACPGGYTQEPKEPSTKCTLRLYSVSCQLKVPRIREFIHYLVINLRRLFRFHSAMTDYIVCLFPPNLTLFPSKFTEKCTSAMSLKNKKKETLHVAETQSGFRHLPNCFIWTLRALFPNIELPLYRHNGASERVFMQLIPHEKVSLHQMRGITWLYCRRSWVLRGALARANSREKGALNPC